MKVKPDLNLNRIPSKPTFLSQKTIKINVRFLFSLIGFGIGSVISLVIIIFEDNKVDLDIFSYHSDFYHLAIPIFVGLTGTFIGFLFGKNQDIKQDAVQTLFLNQQLLNLIFDNLPVLISYLDPNFRYIYVNKTYEDWYGISIHDIEGNLMKEVVDPETYGLISLNSKSCSNGQAISFENERTLKGSKHFVHTTLVPHLASNQQVLGYFTVVADISELKKREQKIAEQNNELAALNATKDKFFSIIAHDLRNPFSSLLGFTEILFNDYDSYDEDTRKKFIKAIHESSENTYQLLENLLAWSRSQSGKIEFNPTVVNIKALVNENLVLLNQVALEKNIHLKSDISRDIFVSTDRDLINTIIRNLMTNALKFTPENGEVSVSGRIVHDDLQNEFVEIAVKDTGIGISPEGIQKLFKIENNFISKGTKGESGTGLGLILCKEFIEKCEGKIRVESKPGKGSVFSFSLPNK